MLTLKYFLKRKLLSTILMKKVLFLQGSEENMLLEGTQMVRRGVLLANYVKQYVQHKQLKLKQSQDQMAADVQLSMI